MAGSPNAFLDTAKAQTKHAHILSEQDPNARSAKRARLSENAVASIHVQCAQADTSLEVDHMILDYIAYQTINACLASRSAEDSEGLPHSLSSSFSMSHTFLAMFKARHPTYKPDAELRLRIALLKLATLFTQRLTSNPTTPPPSALARLRAANNDRARIWISGSGSLPSSILDRYSEHFDNNLPLSPKELERNRAHILHSLDIPAEDEDYDDAFYGTSACVSLLDILPLFMELSAARIAADNSNLNPLWMQLAFKFMLQACLEQYLAFGASGLDAVDEAFAWGYLDAMNDRMDVDGMDKEMQKSGAEVNAMFEDEDYETEVDGWTQLKVESIEQLIPRDLIVIEGEEKASDLLTHLEELSAKQPLGDFEAALLNFLQGIAKSVPEPVLVQLENGRLNGLTEQETQDFLKECGVGGAKFFDPPAGFKAALD